jgi:hypothetical protein
MSSSGLPAELLLPQTLCHLTSIACIGALDAARNAWQCDRYGRSDVTAAFPHNAAALAELLSLRRPPANAILAAAFQSVIALTKRTARVDVAEHGGALLVALASLARQLRKGGANTTRATAIAGAWVAARNVVRLGDAAMFCAELCQPAVVEWVSDSLERHSTPPPGGSRTAVAAREAAAAPDVEERRFLTLCLERIAAACVPGQPHGVFGGRMRRLVDAAMPNFVQLGDHSACAAARDVVGRLPVQLTRLELELDVASDVIPPTVLAPAPAPPPAAVSPAQHAASPFQRTGEGASPDATQPAGDDGSFAVQELRDFLSAALQRHRDEMAALDRLAAEEAGRGTLLRRQLAEAEALRGSLVSTAA